MSKWKSKKYRSNPLGTSLGTNHTDQCQGLQHIRGASTCLKNQLAISCLKCKKACILDNNSHLRKEQPKQTLSSHFTLPNWPKARPNNPSSIHTQKITVLWQNRAYSATWIPQLISIVHLGQNQFKHFPYHQSKLSKALEATCNSSNPFGHFHFSDLHVECYSSIQKVSKQSNTWNSIPGPQGSYTNHHLALKASPLPDRTSTEQVSSWTRISLIRHC